MGQAKALEFILVSSCTVSSAISFVRTQEGHAPWYHMQLHAFKVCPEDPFVLVDVGNLPKAKGTGQLRFGVLVRGYLFFSGSNF